MWTCATLLYNQMLCAKVANEKSHTEKNEIESQYPVTDSVYDTF